MKSVFIALLATTLLAGASQGQVSSESRSPLTSPTLENVTFEDGFWAPRLETNRTVTLPHNWKLCEETGRIRNFEIAAGETDGKFEGIYFNDSDVYKMVEGAAYTLAHHPDPALDAKLDKLIATFAAAQREDGYLYTFYTVNNQLDQRFTNLKDKHELYCAGHLIEAGVAHHQATGKRNLLDVAIKFADLIDRTFGPDKRHDVPGHEEIEMALFRLADETGEERYRKLGEFFVDIRGRETDGRKLYGEYHQDSRPVVDSTEVIGHAVRQMYLLCAATDMARYDDEPEYRSALDRLWEDLTVRKMYLTGGVGAKHEGEAFGEAFDLPNESAYAETCAGIGAMLWNHRMHLLHGDSKYIDALERTLYNGFLSGVSLKGDTFFYVNPLASAGKHHRTPWFDCACCPPNVLRFMANLPALAYATGDDTAYVNLFTTSHAKLTLGDGRAVELRQTTNYPWDEKVSITVETPGEFAVAMRIPAWCKGSKVGVTNADDARIDVREGYAFVRANWKAGDTIELVLPMLIQRVKADPRVKANVGRVAIQRGPVVYCVEGVDNNGRALNAVLPPAATLTPEHDAKLLNGVTLIKSDSGLTFVPYYAWDNRDAGEMAVWVKEAE